MYVYMPVYFIAFHFNYIPICCADIHMSNDLKLISQVRGLSLSLCLSVCVREFVVGQALPNYLFVEFK